MTTDLDLTKYKALSFGVPPRFRTADPIGSDPEWRMSDAGTAQEIHA